MQDAELLREYVTSGSDTAFTELVDRYVDFVYATARRQVGNAQLAEEVAQVVFSLLARKAVGLVDLPSLAGWLYRATCFTAARTLRTERRRRHHEQEAANMRVSRAIERLREFFSKRGVAVGASGLAAVLAANAVHAAPIGLSTAISTGAALSAAVHAG